jgi:hypothetical protein
MTDADMKARYLQRIVDARAALQRLLSEAKASEAMQGWIRDELDVLAKTESMLNGTMSNTSQWQTVDRDISAAEGTVADIAKTRRE